MKEQIITVLLCLTIILFLLFIHQNEYYAQDDDTIDFSNPSLFIETTSQPTKEEIQRKRDIRRERSFSDDNDTIDFSDPSLFIETTSQPTKEEIQRKREIHKELSGEKINCISRCDCCWKNPTSSDRLNACSAKYKVGTPDFSECMSVNSKHAKNACKSKFGKGIWMFKTC